MASNVSQKRVPAAPAIPDRLYFKIGDVARICEVETYVLRFWESQFPQLKPNKGGTGHRLYRRKDVELALEIKRLVHTEGYTIAGARQALEQGMRRGSSTAAQQPVPTCDQQKDRIAAVIGHARAELREIAGQLAQPHPQLTRRRARVTAMKPISGNLFPV